MWLCSVVPGGGDGLAVTQAGKHLKVRFKETNIVPVMEAGAAQVRCLLSDFHYHHVIQVSGFAGGFWPVSGRRLKTAALFVLSSFLSFV